MRLEKHVHGLMVFVIILTCILAVYELFDRPLPRTDARAESVTVEAPAAEYDVRLVSLDFINGHSYTTLSLKLQPGQPAPEKLLVSTRFYVPGGAESQSWTSEVGVKINRPLEEGGRFEVTVASACDWCARSDTPKAGYFADVYVSDQYEGKPLTESDGAPVEAAVPVVVQAERKPRR